MNKVINYFKIKKIDPCLSRAEYYGFTLKPYSWYGTSPAGMPVASNGATDSFGNVGVWFRIQGEWKFFWMDTEYPLFPIEFIDWVAE